MGVIQYAIDYYKPVRYDIDDRLLDCECYMILGNGDSVIVREYNYWTIENLGLIGHFDSSGVPLYMRHIKPDAIKINIDEGAKVEGASGVERQGVNRSSDHKTNT